MGVGGLEIKILQVCLWNLGGKKITKKLVSAQPWFGFHGVEQNRRDQMASPLPGPLLVIAAELSSVY